MPCSGGNVLTRMNVVDLSASLLGTNVCLQFGMTPTKMTPKGGPFIFLLVPWNDKLSHSSQFLCAQCSVLPKLVTGESPIRGPFWLPASRACFPLCVLEEGSCPALLYSLKSLGASPACQTQLLNTFILYIRLRID